MMMAMTSRPELRSLLLLLLTTSSMVSSRRLLTVGEASQNTETSTQHHDDRATPHTGSEVPSTKAPSPTTVLKAHDGGSTTVQHISEMVTNQHSKRSETPHPSARNESHASERLPAGTENPAGSESPLHTQLPALPPGSSSPTLPVRNTSSDSTSPPRTSPSIALVSAISRKVTPNPIASTVTVLQDTMMSKSATNGRSSQQQTTGQSDTERNATMSVHSAQTQTTLTTRGVKGHTCSTITPKRESLVSRCLIAIALLAALVTIFIVSTIILATKLAGHRYRHKAELLEELDTEMICISRVIGGEAERPVPKPRHPRSNGALIPTLEDEDGDDLTLNSFLPDTECAT